MPVDSYKLCMYVVVPRATTKGTIQSNTLKILDRSKHLFNQKKGRKRETEEQRENNKMADFKS